MSTLYADLSHHDWDRVKGEFDWAAVRRATSPVLCVRATYGDPAGYNPTSRHVADMVLGARRAGFDTIGGYHNLIRGDAASINRQVDYLRRTLDGVGAVWAMLDVERYPELVERGLHPRFDDARRFADRWHAVDPRVLTVYLPRWIWDGHMGRPDLRLLDSPLVASNYGSNPNGSPSAVYAARGGDAGVGWAPCGGVTPAIWQYGSNIDCPGASGATDVNAYRGTLAQLRALLTGTPLEDDMPTAAEIAAAVWAHPIASPAMDVDDPRPAADWLKGGTAAERAAGRVGAAVAALRTDLAALAGRDLVDEQQVAAQLAPALLAVLTPQAIAAAIPATVARQVADELAARLTA